MAGDGGLTECARCGRPTMSPWWSERRRLGLCETCMRAYWRGIELETRAELEAAREAARPLPRNPTRRRAERARRAGLEQVDWVTTGGTDHEQA